FHDNVSQFGDRPYKGRQISGYANILYSNRFGALERSKLTAGASFQMDFVNEFLSTRLLADQAAASQNIKRNELVPGIFAEYSYSIEDKLVVMPGIRLDYNVAYNKLFWTPRLHIKWQAGKNSSFRFSAGKGYRVSNVITENQSLLISNRDFVFDDAQGDKADLNKGLLPEEAYNAGVSFVQSFDMPGGKSTFSIDYYYTHFINQTIIDMDQDIHSIHVYNLNGNFNGKGNKSYSHSAQAELILNPIQRFEIILAYRYNLVKQTTNHTLQDKALTSPHKALISLSYATKYDKWKFNVSLQYHSKMRLPDMSSNPVEYQPTPSKGYFMLNAQITKKYKAWEFYIGGENLANQKQANPIISADNPYGEYFDASIIHSPISGIMGYIGFRYSMK
ncbi:MAG: TonB-dependent receptor, partial [Bacteroidales bacterium]|nr:TonB-dependent receptor [Bacteroidales bacterium]